MTRQFNLSGSVQDGTAVLAVTGKIGPEAAAKLGHAIVAAVSGPAVSHVVVDLAAVDSIDESGLESLVSGDRAAVLHGCTLRIASPSPTVINAAMEGLRVTEDLRGHVKDAALRLFPRADQTG
ncbi:MAG: STAS domain-containing protein [Pseudonocardiaceae bacterium]